MNWSRLQFDGIQCLPEEFDINEKINEAVILFSPNTKVLVKSSKLNNLVEISVSDNGVGDWSTFTFTIPTADTLAHLPQ